MAAVVLILGLVAAGVYTSSWGFYVAAGLGGGVYALIMAAIAGATANIVNEVKRDPSRFNIRNNNR